MKRDKVHILLTIHKHSPDFLGLYETGQVPARAASPKLSRSNPRSANWQSLKLRVNCNEFPALQNRTSEVSTDKPK